MCESAAPPLPKGANANRVLEKPELVPTTALHGQAQNRFRCPVAAAFDCEHFDILVLAQLV
jgi:hypothetical protein